jgi:ceramide glucosyltransferase
MSAALLFWPSGCGTALALAATAYLLIASLALRAGRAAGSRQSVSVPPTTILKPLCGTEPGLYACLRSFCALNVPQLQIVFGVSEPDDPALAVVRRLESEFPQLDLQVAVNPVRHGSNAKVSNLINMLPLARHDYLVIADSDVRVQPNYLEMVVMPLLDNGVGIVTCLYRGSPGAGLWSLLGSLFVNEWFIPSVRVAALFGSRTFAFGATIALRRDTLHRIGGFPRIANQLPDDYRLGELTRRLGLRTVLCSGEVETCVNEPDLRALLQHELRWLRTIRTVQPLGYALAVVTLGWPIAALGALVAGGSGMTLALLAGAVIARLMVSSAPRRARSLLKQLALVALNDLIMLSLWVWSFANDRIRWREGYFRVARDGTLQPLP